MPEISAGDTASALAKTVQKRRGPGRPFRKDDDPRRARAYAKSLEAERRAVLADLLQDFGREPTTMQRVPAWEATM